MPHYVQHECNRLPWKGEAAGNQKVHFCVSSLALSSLISASVWEHLAFLELSVRAYCPAAESEGLDEALLGRAGSGTGAWNAFDEGAGSTALAGVEAEAVLDTVLGTVHHVDSGTALGIGLDIAPGAGHVVVVVGVPAAAAAHSFSDIEPIDDHRETHLCRQKSDIAGAGLVGEE